MIALVCVSKRGGEEAGPSGQKEGECVVVGLSEFDYHWDYYYDIMHHHNQPGSPAFLATAMRDLDGWMDVILRMNEKFMLLHDQTNYLLLFENLGRLTTNPYVVLIMLTPIALE